jgi:translation elongation factor EF-Ts
MSAYPYHRYVHSYVHGGRVGALVEFGLETHMVTESAEFLGLAKDIAMHVTAMNPTDVNDMLDQGFARDTGRTIRAVLLEASSRLGERITVTRIARLDAESSAPAPEPPSTPPRSPAKVLNIAGRK